jgi:hypothetical protein
LICRFIMSFPIRISIQCRSLGPFLGNVLLTYMIDFTFWRLKHVIDYAYAHSCSFWVAEMFRTSTRTVHPAQILAVTLSVVFSLTARRSDVPNFSKTLQTLSSKTQSILHTRPERISSSRSASTTWTTSVPTNRSHKPHYQPFFHPVGHAVSRVVGDRIKSAPLLSRIDPAPLTARVRLCRSSSRRATPSSSAASRQALLLPSHLSSCTASRLSGSTCSDCPIISLLRPACSTLLCNNSILVERSKPRVPFSEPAVPFTAHSVLRFANNLPSRPCRIPRPTEQRTQRQWRRRARRWDSERTQREGERRAGRKPALTASDRQ